MNHGMSEQVATYREIVRNSAEHVQLIVLSIYLFIDIMCFCFLYLRAISYIICTD